MEIPCALLLVWVTFKVEWLDIYIDFSSSGEGLHVLQGNGMVAPHVFKNHTFTSEYILQKGSRVERRERGGGRLDKHAQSESASLTFPLVAHPVGTPRVQHDWSVIKPLLMG